MASRVLGQRFLVPFHKLCSTNTTTIRPHLAISRRSLSVISTAQSRLQPQIEPRFSFRGSNIFDSVSSKRFSQVRAFSSSSGDNFDDPVSFDIRLDKNLLFHSRILGKILPRRLCSNSSYGEWRVVNVVGYV